MGTYLGNHGHSTCSDLQRSGRYPGMTWSYQACATPYLTSDVCSYLLQSYYSNNNNGNYRNPIKPRIRDSQVEGVYEDPEYGKIKKGTKWLRTIFRRKTKFNNSIYSEKSRCCSIWLNNIYQTIVIFFIPLLDCIHSLLIHYETE